MLSVSWWCITSWLSSPSRCVKSRLHYTYTSKYTLPCIDYTGRCRWACTCQKTVQVDATKSMLNAMCLHFVLACLCTFWSVCECVWFFAHQWSVGLVRRERQRKQEFAEYQRGLGGSYMRTAVTTLHLLLELVSDDDVVSAFLAPSLVSIVVLCDTHHTL